MDAINRYVFGVKTPEELVRHWKSSIRAQERQLDREIRDLATQDAKARAEMKLLAKRNDMKGVRMLGRELVRARKHRERMHTSKAQLNSISMQLQHQLALAKVAGTLKRSTTIMHSVNSLMRLPVLSRQMQEMAMEMTKAGVIEEMMADTLDGLDDMDEIDEAADEEVEKIIYQVTDGRLGELGAVAAAPLPELNVPEFSQEETNVEEMQARLQALRG